MRSEQASKAGRIFLVGMMGAGKTTVGKLLARRLSRRFVDTDQEVQNRTGVNITTIFEIEGESGFRRRESAILKELAARVDLVVATGGGIVLASENRELLKSSGTVVYLRASVDDLFGRTRRDRSRPLLQTEDPRAKLSDLLAVRDPLYREVADIIMDTSTQSVHALVRQLERKLSSA